MADDRVLLGDLIGEGAAILKDAGVPESRRRARQIVGALLDLEMAELLREAVRTVCGIDADRCRTAFRQSACGVPLSRICGEREFWGLPFAVSDATLDPRPDTETVIEAVLDLIPDRSSALSLIDIGTGTGVLAVSLLTQYGAARAVAIDRSPEALATARSNAERNRVDDRVSFVAADWLSAMGGTFDLILSNPPYVRSGDIDQLDPGVRDHDPILALDGGADGLDCYRAIFRDVAPRLRDGGWLVVEIGAGTADGVRAEAQSTFGRARMRELRDLAGVIRVLGFQPTDRIARKIKKRLE